VRRELALVLAFQRRRDPLDDVAPQELGAAPEQQTDGDGRRPLLPRGRAAIDARDRQDEPVQRQNLVREVGGERQDREKTGRSGGHGADDAAAHGRVLDQPIDEVVAGILRVSLAEFPNFVRDLVAIDVGQHGPRESDVHGLILQWPTDRNMGVATVLSFRGYLERSRS
jgi:hypothetical protein